MPYARIAQRSRYNPVILEVVKLIMTGTEAKMLKGELLAFFVNRICRIFMQTTDYEKQAFNSHLFPAVKVKALRDIGSKVCSFFDKDDPLNSAEELSYVIGAITWGCLGDHPEVDKADYGFRAYIKGLFDQLKDGLANATFDTPTHKDSTIALRRYVLVKGVVSDVMDETFRRRSAAWLNQRIKDNGDLWEDGKLLEKIMVAPVITKV